MADLIAQGEEAQERWRRALPDGERVVLGRAAGAWAVPWDQHVSRQHAELVWTAGRLEIAQLPQAANPVYYRGKQSARFSIRPGEHFVIGSTTFTLTDQQAHVASDAPQPVQQQSYSSQYLKQIRFRNPDYRIEVLSRLPDVISGATGSDELCVRLVSMLLAGIPRAHAAAVVVAEGPDAVVVEGPEKGTGTSGTREGPEKGTGTSGTPSQSPFPSAGSDPEVRVLHWDQRLAVAGDFQPSRRLVLQALRQRQSVLHVWQGAEPPLAQAFTARGDFDWAFCSPVLGEACPGWMLYVTGRFSTDLPATPVSESSDPNDLREDMKFTELVAATLNSLRQMQLLNRRQATLSQFLSPVVLGTLGHEDPDVVLAPRETEVAVLFCDLRGFSRHSERHADDLLELLRRVSQALGVMTHHILEQGGVVGDFQGDAAMGFWGWPLAQADSVLRCCRAALAIRTQFEQAARDPQSPLAKFQAGIGIATGRAVAGKIGTADHVKVTVFGPVVNLASRLEGMTKTLRASILLDEAAAQAARRQVPREVGRVRRLAVVQPYGLDTPLEVSELLPPAAQGGKGDSPHLPRPAVGRCPPSGCFAQMGTVPFSPTDEHLECFEAALDAFLEGRWPAAFELLHRIPAEDVAADFLTVYIAQHNRTPPRDWNGVIVLGNK